ncbi:alpha-lytic protease prodomain-containing protein [Streptosporangium sp. G11]|uniref:S1 family peptidase n=1 Tax=Streptosporangium sp. G11 TaxID=3436926 RepID=UPI003EBF3495
MPRSHIAVTGCLLAITALALTPLPSAAARWAAGTARAPVSLPAVAPSPPSGIVPAPLPAVTPPRPVGIMPAPVALPAGTTPTPVARPAAPAPGTPNAPVVLNPPPGLIEALQRDLGLTRAQVEARLLNEARLTVVEARLRQELGSRFGGSWFTGILAQTLMIATTSAADIPRITAAGARAQVVRVSLETLRAIKRRLDGALPASPIGGSVRYVDVRNNRVVILSRYASATEAAIVSIGMDTSLVVVLPSLEDPRPANSHPHTLR